MMPLAKKDLFSKTLYFSIIAVNFVMEDVITIQVVE